MRFGATERKCDEEQRDADAVVQPGLDVEPLSDSRRNPDVGDDHLPERGVGRRQDDREQQRLAEAELSEEAGCERKAREDRERETDPEQPRGHEVLPPQRGEVDPRGVGEQHQRESRLGQQANRLAASSEIDPPEALVAEEQPARDEEDRRRDRRPVEPARDRRVHDDDPCDDGERPAHLRRRDPAGSGKIVR